MARSGIAALEKLLAEHAGKQAVSPVVAIEATGSLLHWLAATLADRADADYDDVLLDLRQQLADWERG